MALDPHSAVLMALYTGKPDIAEALASAAPALTIWEAAALGRDDVVAALVGSDRTLINAHAPDGHTPLGLAAFFGQPSTVLLLLDQGADPVAASTNDMKVQPLHAAVAGRNVEAVRLLIERGADVNARQQIGYTPLMGAASAGRQDLVRLLLDHGADRTLLSDDGKSAADIAREHGHLGPDLA